jgi:hypothetical protein
MAPKKNTTFKGTKQKDNAVNEASSTGEEKSLTSPKP